MKTNQPPYTITPKILNLVASVQTILGESMNHLVKKPSIRLRKENRIKTIHCSLAIEGNSMTEAQISSMIDGKKVIGSKNEISEVKNAIQLYDRISQFNPISEKDFLKAHEILMKGLIAKPGFYRQQGVGIFKNGQVSRIAPPAKQVSKLMSDLFLFLKNDKSTLPLLKACIFHYELEFIHPFEDGNGRMGRLWQQLLLMRVSPVFEFTPIESLIYKNQKKYYQALEKSDVKGESTDFIEFSLDMILDSLREFSGEILSTKASSKDRIGFASEHFDNQFFSRKEYMLLFKEISTATASRDLAEAVAQNLILKKGDKSQAKYKFKR